MALGYPPSNQSVTANLSPVRAGPGRPKGARNRVHLDTLAHMPGHNMLDKLRRMGCDPFAVMVEVARGKLTCAVCDGRGKVRYKSADDNKLRQCSSCHGSGWDYVAPADRARTAAELARYCAPQLKAIEVKSEGHTHIEVRWAGAPVAIGQIESGNVGPTPTPAVIDAAVVAAEDDDV